MRQICAFFFSILCLIGISAPSYAQTPIYSFSFTNIADIPSGNSHLVTVNIRWNGTPSGFSGVPNPLFGTTGSNYGVQGGGVAIRISTGSVGSVVTAMTPVYGTDVTVASGFNSALTTMYSKDDLDLFNVQVPNYDNLIGATMTSTSAPAGVNVGSSAANVDLPLVTFRITGLGLGSVTIQANLDDLEASPTNFVYGSPASGQPFADLISPGTATFNVIAAVPEPATWAMIILSITAGIGGIVYYRHQRLSQANHQLAMLEESATE